MDPIERLLAEIKAESEPQHHSPNPEPPPPKAAAKSQPSTSIDDLLATLNTPPQKPTPAAGAAAITPSISSPAIEQKLPTTQLSADDPLLQAVKAKFTAQDQAEAELRQQQQQAEQLRQQQLREQQRLALTAQAQAWLDKLELHSEEGLWFEEFCSCYPSRLDAAIEYLQALSKGGNPAS